MSQSHPANLEDFVRLYLHQLAQSLGQLNCQAIAQAIQWMRECRDAGRYIYACGNGGSALIASQMVVDVIKGASYGRAKRFKMLALTDSPGTIMAYANDVDYEVVFVEQLKNFAQPGDLLIGISGSGNSANVLRAVEYARSIGCRTIGLTTSQGGQLKDLVDLAILVPTSHMGRLEDCFFAITHVLCYAFIEAAE
ncbi:MAG: SIS domain-containing protein [Thermoguttaceae bacterium]|nr:SIS domain-containing protein [Thermoguttaceae bacterium]MDW8037031.1 SIS domain-containing protein [Thermoguttaceae bacterium]